MKIRARLSDHDQSHLAPQWPPQKPRLSAWPAFDCKVVWYYGADFIAATVLKSETGKSVGFPLFTLLLCTNNSNTSDDP